MFLASSLLSMLQWDLYVAFTKEPDVHGSIPQASGEFSFAVSGKQCSSVLALIPSLCEYYPLLLSLFPGKTVHALPCPMLLVSCLPVV